MNSTVTMRNQPEKIVSSSYKSPNMIKKLKKMIWSSMQVTQSTKIGDQ